MRGVRVLDFSTGIAGPYCTKLFADAGADVVKVEPPGGDELRHWRSGGLFEYLNESKRSVSTAGLLVGSADVVCTGDAAEAKEWQASHPSAVVVSITPFGADGPWAGRPATELTLQAACGSIGSRGVPEEPPIPIGGRLGEWVTGTYAALAVAAALGLSGSRQGGRRIDVAMLDCMAVSLVTYPSVFASFAGWPSFRGTGRTIEVPSIEPTKDGYAVFTTNSAQQFEDFLTLIGRRDWLADERLARALHRFSRRAEFLEAVWSWSRERSTAQALEEAALLRIPAGPVLDGSSVAGFEQFVAREVYRRSPSGRFREPRIPYRIEGEEPPEQRPAPGPGADDGLVDWQDREQPAPRLGEGPPLGGLRVLDCTAWWAGPAATHALASLGADVIKVESVTRPDLMRTTTTRPPGNDLWWEWGPLFHAVNVSKRGVTLDLTTPEGVRLLEQLAARADLLVENFTPRVMEQFGLGWDRLQEVNPRLVMVRMPAFGLDGPWRDRTGFAQTMECISGMAWVTGNPGGPPVLPRGACDPLAAMHAAFAAIVALRARAADGRGRLVESTLIESALSVTAEQVIEWDASGCLLCREGARGPGSPQGVYRCAGEDEWVALAVTTDQEWAELCRITGIAPVPGWQSAEGRRSSADELDALVSAWCAPLDKDDAAERLVEAGIPAAAVVSGPAIAHNPQLLHRGLFETEDHPVTGRHQIPGLPFRMTGQARWMTRPAPTLGQHNDEVLGEIASAEELAELRRSGVIGERWAAR